MPNSKGYVGDNGCVLFGVYDLLDNELPVIIGNASEIRDYLNLKTSAEVYAKAFHSERRKVKLVHKYRYIVINLGPENLLDSDDCE